MKAVPERIVVLVEHDVGGSAVLRCKTVALSRERDAVVRAAIDAAMSVSEDGSRWRADVTWRRVDVASVGLSPRESDAHERLALPGRAFASLDTIDLGGVALPLATADGASSFGASASHAERTCATIWDGSVVLAKFLEEEYGAGGLAGLSVIELGAGSSALPGLACAALGATTVVLTDHDQALLGVSRRVEQVAPLLGSACRLEASPLDWTRKLPPRLVTASFDVVLASDVVWLGALVAPLVSTATALLRRRPSSVFFLAHQTRSAYVDDLLFAEFEHHGLVAERQQRPASSFAPQHVSVWRVTPAPGLPS